MKMLFVVGLGSFIGGVLRYSISLMMQSRLQHFPWNTFLVNIVGCFLIGLLFGYADKSGMSANLKLFLGTGLLGGFTTFSAFSMESFRMLQLNAYGNVAMYVLGSVVFGLGATFLGVLLGKLI